VLTEESVIRAAPTSRSVLLARVRWTLGLFIMALIVSGLTAFPLQLELEQLSDWLGTTPDQGSGLGKWILLVRDGLRESYGKYPWIAYGTDWLAFAHIIIALFFIGPLTNPVRNIWVLWAGLIACAMVLPLALICGPFRQIPLGWRLIDCSFGIFGAIPLAYCLKWTRRLERWEWGAA